MPDEFCFSEAQAEDRRQQEDGQHISEEIFDRHAGPPFQVILLIRLSLPVLITLIDFPPVNVRFQYTAFRLAWIYPLIAIRAKRVSPPVWKSRRGRTSCTRRAAGSSSPTPRLQAPRPRPGTAGWGQPGR